jgi:hypothetical protein
MEIQVLHVMYVETPEHGIIIRINGIDANTDEYHFKYLVSAKRLFEGNRQIPVRSIHFVVPEENRDLALTLHRAGLMTYETESNWSIVEEVTAYDEGPSVLGKVKTLWEKTDNYDRRKPDPDRRSNI